MVMGERYFRYSAFSAIEKAFYYNQIYVFLRWISVEYPGFRQWYEGLFCDDKKLRKGREIVICEKDCRIAGVAILKSTKNEKKICTLRVAKLYQKQGIGTKLMELSFEWLEEDKPLITMDQSKRHEFDGLLRYYGFSLEQMKKNYYGIFNTELIYNGVLPEKVRTAVPSVGFLYLCGGRHIRYGRYGKRNLAEVIYQ